MLRCTVLFPCLRWMRTAPLLAVLLAAVLAGCGGQARTQADCDQLLQEEKFSETLRKCDDPFYQASAYLGLGGFDIFSLVNSTADAGKVAVLLGLTVSNVDTKREYFNKALAAVNPPHGGDEAFAALVAAFLGMAVTTSEYLDNGQGGGTALDDDYSSGEVDAAVGVTGSGTPSLIVYDSVDHYAVRHGGKNYVFDCTSATLPCGSGPTYPLVYDDADGSGRLDTSGGESTAKAAILADLAGITSAARVVQLQDVDIVLSLLPATFEPTTSYLGRNPSPVTYDTGLTTYLAALTAATDELESATGSTGGSDLTDQVDAITDKLDNGGACGGSSALVDELGKIYLAAAGTISKPAPNSFGTSNLLAVADIPDLILTAPLFPTITAANLAFTVDHYKLLFSTNTANGSFSIPDATPRADAAYSAFQTRFEYVWMFSPGASPAGDNAVNVAEVACSAD